MALDSSAYCTDFVIFMIDNQIYLLLMFDLMLHKIVLCFYVSMNK